VDITVNGETQTVADNSTVADLVRALDLEQKRIAVEFNRQILRRELYAEQMLAAGDEVEIVHFVGGG